MADSCLRVAIIGAGPNGPMATRHAAPIDRLARGSASASPGHPKQAKQLRIAAIQRASARDTRLRGTT